jgi:hypothetical protein
MFSTLGELQNALVNALLDDVEVADDWRKAFLHAEFKDVAEQVEILAEAFVVPAEPTPQRPPLLFLSSPVLRALEALYFGYRDMGQKFAQLDVTVAAPDGRYRFEFSDEPSLRLAGDSDPAASTRLADRYADLLREASW